MKTLLVLLAAFYSFAGSAAGSAAGTVAGSFAAPDPADSLLVVSWNVENFLDYRSDTTGRHTRKRFYSKCNAIAKTLLLISEEKGRLPDAVALMEVGDRFVLERLIRDTPLRKLDYAIVHYDSPDRRGIDCALLYRRSTLKLLRSAPVHLYDSTGAVMSTRDILLAEFGGLDILVNHHPSKVGADSERRRAVAMARMRELMDSLAAAPSTFWAGSVDGSAESGPPSTKTASGVDGSAEIGPPSSKAASGVDGSAESGLPSTKTASARAILAVGDFNDDVWPHDGPREAYEGTIKFSGAWEKIDGHFALGPLEVHESVFAHPLLTEPDRSFGGTKPRRAFSGPRWLGGVSDHYPVIFRIVIACATTFD